MRSWKDHYEGLASAGRPWLDYSNQRVQLQTLCLALEAAGSVDGNKCLDAGCGNGQLSLAIRGFGPKQVTAFDLVAAMAEALATTAPEINTLVGDASDPHFMAGLGMHDIVFCVEMLQYVAHDAVLPLLWERVARAGRLILFLPNASCPIVKKVRAEFAGRYHAADLRAFGALVEKLPDMAMAAWRPLAFASDQRIQPYVAGPWDSDFGRESDANRIQVVVLRN